MACRSALPNLDVDNPRRQYSLQWDCALCRLVGSGRGTPQLLKARNAPTEIERSLFRKVIKADLSYLKPRDIGSYELLAPWSSASESFPTCSTLFLTRNHPLKQRDPATLAKEIRIPHAPCRSSMIWWPLRSSFHGSKL